MYIVRIGPNGMKDSAPCVDCSTKMKELGIKKIIYSNSDGEVNTMMAPIKTMVGDTAAIQYSFYDDWRGEETNGVFYVIFD